MEFKLSITCKRLIEMHTAYITKDKPRLAVVFGNEILGMLKVAMKRQKGTENHKTFFNQVTAM